MIYSIKVRDLEGRLVDELPQVYAKNRDDAIEQTKTILVDEGHSINKVNIMYSYKVTKN